MNSHTQDSDVVEMVFLNQFDGPDTSKLGSQLIQFPCVYAHFALIILELRNLKRGICGDLKKSLVS